jgi:DNA-binding ferritin-like protein
MEMRRESINTSNDNEGLNLPEMTVSDLEATEHFGHYVAEALDKLGEVALADLVKANKISSIGLEAKKTANAGNHAEKLNKSDYDVNEFMAMRAEMVAKELIKNKKEHLN